MVKNSQRSDIHLFDINFDLLKSEETSSSKIAVSLPQMSTNSGQVLNYSRAFQEVSGTLFVEQDREILSN